ncbi:Methyltransferase type 11 [Xylanimonas cellulosilytica DSM 15894]|uniref:Arsenite methyltransferase n=1 Tax=Xylanimonas cellulosilytica (strain DSM 15894 / JCM 12276 / CECT 5975 / KCTC 9989 / LMG 20990 / NBRC 107835 / XIL07) TaxID=446471 RepID=D1BRT0_XYLCX|nr:arsenite methyltransferase [Xylanimonas cellulosilytica]ACZ32346.1 Methyltransferase type 11 [Xylanimonas cellulosilytica DSM 15894]
MAVDETVREQVRDRYAQAAKAAATGNVAENASCCSTSATSCSEGEGGTGPTPVSFGSGLYDATNLLDLPETAVLASLGCGNPTAVAELRAGERVLDLGSGGGIDVLLSAKRVGATGFAYGVDMTDEMLELARANAAQAGATNVEFRKGTIEDLPFEDASIDVVISNCVVNLSTDKPAVLSEVFRVLAPGGRVGISDVVAEDDVAPEQRAERGSYVGCVAGALSKQEYLDGLAAAGFTDTDVTFTHEVAAGMHGAIVKAVKPTDAR